MKKKMNFIKLGLAFAGCFLGAGYVSGQELWQFFGSFGKSGTLGLLIAITLLFAVGYVMISLNRLTGIEEADRLIIPWDAPLPRHAVSALELIFLFGVSTIMAAGVGALLEELFGLPLVLGCAAFTLLVAAVSLAGLEGMVSAFSVSVPILVGVTLAFGVSSVAENGITVVESASGANSLMGSWFIAALSFACYNIFGSIAMIAPLGKFVRSGKAAAAGIFAGAVLLLMIAGSVLVSVSASPETIGAELPMLALAKAKSPVLGYVYGFLLFLAMFGTALSSMVAFTNLLCLKSERIARKRLLLICVYAAGMFAGSLFGFGGLISVIYPIFGYASSVFIILMTVNYFKNRRKKANDDPAKAL